MITNNGFLWIFSAGGAVAAVFWRLLSLLLGEATVDGSDDDDTVPPLRDFFLLLLRRRTAPFEFDSVAMVGWWYLVLRSCVCVSSVFSLLVCRALNGRSLLVPPFKIHRGKRSRRLMLMGRISLSKMKPY